MQTGSGKTFTIYGTPSEPGLTPRGVTELFKVINRDAGKYSFSVSLYMLELYQVFVGAGWGARCRMVGRQRRRSSAQTSQCAASISNNVVCCSDTAPSAPSSLLLLGGGTLFAYFSDDPSPPRTCPRYRTP